MTAIDDGHNFFNPRMILANGTAEDVSSSAMDCFTAVPVHRQTDAAVIIPIADA
jgi:hypothetical protein